MSECLSAWDRGLPTPPLVEAGPAWYAVHTRSNFEKLIHTELEQRGIESYWPAFDEVHQWKDRKKRVERAVFPGYVFVQILDKPETQIQVLRTNGVVRILGNGSGIEAIPETEIDSVRRLLESRKQCCAHPLLREGAWVRVKRGPLRDVEGRLIRLKNETRLVLTINLLSQSVSTEVDIRDVEPIRPGETL
ncbi:MAG: UpxY family transcription antiterminator [Bryobacteraceae bacterium]